jgi:glucose/arabinose dehydrogenase
MRRLVVAVTATLCLTSAAQAAPDLMNVVRAKQPVYVTSAPDNPSRLFVVEQLAGQVRVVDLAKGQTLPRPFLDLSSRVQTGGLRGLLSIEFSPNYEHNRRFYVFFSARGDRIRIEEYRRSRSDPAVADPSSRRTVLVLRLPDLPASSAPHQGGQLEFGPDGLLYISTGDGSRGFKDSQLPRAAQDRGSLLGKILRIDPVSRQGPYRIPRSNPYAGRTPGRGEVFARGLRNPWRFSFDRTKIALADDGEERREEVNLLSIDQLNGANFGWPRFEGTLRLKPGSRSGLTMPDFEYPHRSNTIQGEDCAGSVIGGYIVRDPNVPSLYGRYVYGDYCFRQVRSFDPADPQGTDRVEFSTPPPNSFGRDALGRIYVAFQGGISARLVESPPPGM